MFGVLMTIMPIALGIMMEHKKEGKGKCLTGKPRPSLAKIGKRR